MCVCFCFSCVDLTELLSINMESDKCENAPYTIFCLYARSWTEANGPCDLCVAGWAVLFSLTV